MSWPGRFDAPGRSIAAAPPPDAVALAQLLSELNRAKYDPYLSRSLLARCYASGHIDPTRLPALASDILTRST